MQFIIYVYVNQKLGKNGQNLTFDLLTPGNKNFWEYNIYTGLNLSSGSKIMPNIKKSNEAFLRYFEKCRFLGQEWAILAPSKSGRFFSKILALSLLSVYDP